MARYPLEQMTGFFDEVDDDECSMRDTWGLELMEARNRESRNLK